MPKKKEETIEEKKPKAKVAKPKKVSEKDFEKKVLELADQGLTCEKIGEKLKKEGIHPRDFSKKISKILRENNKYVDPDLKNTEEKFEKIKKHCESNKQDKRAMREKSRFFSRIRKLKKYRKLI